MHRLLDAPAETVWPLIVMSLLAFAAWGTYLILAIPINPSPRAVLPSFAQVQQDVAQVGYTAPCETTITGYVVCR